MFAKTATAAFRESSTRISYCEYASSGLDPTLCRDPVDRLNARAQHLRAQRGQLGTLELEHPDLPYGLRENDRVIFTSQHRPAGQPRVENGAVGHVTHLADDGTLTVTLDGTNRPIDLAEDDVARVRLAYAQHISTQQGATMTHAFALTGGWQTTRETTYVQATRPRDGCDWFIARDDLGAEGQDEQRIHELADRMRDSRRQTPSLAYEHLPEPETGIGPDIEHADLSPRLLARLTRGDHDPDLHPQITR